MTIRGVGFRVPEIGDVSEYPTVEVEINGVEADGVAAVAHYRVEAIVPEYLGSHEDLPDIVDVTVRNLDDDGVAIPGEEVTAVGAYTYQRPSMIANSTLTEVTLEVLRVFRRYLLLNTVTATDPDFSDDPASGITAIGKLPAIVLDGPRVLPSGMYRYSDQSYDALDDGSGLYAERAAPFTARLEWGILLVSNGKRANLNLLNAVIRHFDSRPFMRVPLEPAGVNFMRVDAKLAEWSIADRREDRLYLAESTLALEPIYLDDEYGAADGGVSVGDIVTAETQESVELEVDRHEPG
jgi:hypothetical protein